MPFGVENRIGTAPTTAVQFQPIVAGTAAGDVPALTAAASVFVLPEFDIVTPDTTVPSAALTTDPVRVTPAIALPAAKNPPCLYAGVYGL